jgi:hypothetical protein
MHFEKIAKPVMKKSYNDAYNLVLSCNPTQPLKTEIYITSFTLSIYVLFGRIFG